MLCKVFIAAFLATSAVALEVKPVCSGHDHCGVRTNDVVA